MATHESIKGWQIVFKKNNNTTPVPVNFLEKSTDFKFEMSKTKEQFILQYNKESDHEQALRGFWVKGNLFNAKGSARVLVTYKA